jgi:predicted DNA-binding transcriptional regulator AlpA
MTNTNTFKPRRILRRRNAADRAGLSVGHMMRRANDPEDAFPAPVKIGPKATGFVEDELDVFIAGCMAERDGDAEDEAPGRDEAT